MQTNAHSHEIVNERNRIRTDSCGSHFTSCQHGTCPSSQPSIIIGDRHNQINHDPHIYLYTLTMLTNARMLLFHTMSQSPRIHVQQGSMVMRRTTKSIPLTRQVPLLFLFVLLLLVSACQASSRPYGVSIIGGMESNYRRPSRRGRHPLKSDLAEERVVNSNFPDVWVLPSSRRSLLLVSSSSPTSAFLKRRQDHHHRRQGTAATTTTRTTKSTLVSSVRHNISRLVVPAAQQQRQRPAAASRQFGGWFSPLPAHADARSKTTTTSDMPSTEDEAFDELGPVGKVVAGTIEIAVSTVLEYISGLLGGYFLGTVTGIPALLTKPVQQQQAARNVFWTQFQQRMGRMHGRSTSWARNWAGISAAFGGFRVTTKVLRGGKEDEWSTVFSSMAAGAFFARKGTYVVAILSCDAAYDCYSQATKIEHSRHFCNQHSSDLFPFLLLF